MRDERRIQERVEVRLGRVQVLWLTLGAVVSLGLMFALGFTLGRRAALLDGEAEPAAGGDPIAQIDEAGEMHDKLTFYDKLTAAQPPEFPLPAARPAPQAEPARPTQPARPEPVRPAADAAPGPTETPSRSPDEAALRDALARKPATPGEYTVQVSAFQTMEEARAFGAALERKGFSPFVVTASIPGKGVWYRVRLGRFESEEHANRAKALLARSDIPAWVLQTE